MIKSRMKKGTLQISKKYLFDDSCDLYATCCKESFGGRLSTVFNRKFCQMCGTPIQKIDDMIAKKVVEVNHAR